MSEQEQVEKLKERDEVKHAFEQTTHARTTPNAVYETRDKVRIAIYAVIFVALAGLYYLVRFHALGLTPGHQAFVRRAALGGALIVLVFILSRLVDVYVTSRVQDAASRFNMRRVVGLIVWLSATLIAVSVLFENWYTAVVSFGIVSLILGFALQTPIMSLLGWVYLMTRAPFRVGDRIRIGDLSGDVIDVGYLDTTLWEFGGEYLSTDHPSGRIIKFPNANVLDTAVINYSWPLFPYIWNEIKFQVAYQSDLAFVGETMRRIVEEELGEAMLGRVSVYRSLLSTTAIDHLEVREHPAVFFRVSDNTWIEAIVRYLVEPKQAGRVKSNLIPKLLSELNASPQSVMFPKADLR